MQATHTKRIETARGGVSPSIAVPLAMGLGGTSIAWGWWNREELYFTPESGTGYALGVYGTAMLVALLGYSVRKRISVTAPVGSIRTWFTVHMVLGLCAPIAILFHANFQLGSLNSSVALACLLLVAGSGVIGRVIYPKVHSGFEGRRASLAELRASAHQRRGVLGQALRTTPGLEEALSEFESSSLDRRAANASLWPLFFLGRRERRIRRRCRRLVKRAGSSAGSGQRLPTRDRLLSVTAYLSAVRAVAEFRAYERIFSLWHALHLPLCIVLFLAAAVHVLAVHMY